MRSDPKGKQRHYSLLLSDNEKRQDSRCNFCKQQHLIYACDKFLKLSISETSNHVKKLGLSSNCLCYGHFSSKCGSGCCKYCSSKHSFLLHYKKPRMEVLNGQFLEVLDSNMILRTVVLTIRSKKFLSVVLLWFVVIKWRTPIMYYYLLLLFTSKTKMDIFKRQMHFWIQEVNALLFLSRFVQKWVQFCKIDLPLANPSFNVPQVVDLLLGADVFWEILLDGRVSLGKNKPLLINTVFGYVVSGSIPNSILKQQVTCNFLQQNDLEKFWLLEELSHDSQWLTMEEDICVEYLKKTVSRDSSGKFIVRLPLKESHFELGESKQMAIERN
ncbi:hypothetical protein HUJ04_008259 [Dendroctonus ponderosae]|nr:hypothetical protein HUJ04_008259 [Dendroctonus ponderosae]KAH1008134.1 hypothetical protein HUJ05_008717 [Dendroctonus ponderosae]